MPYDPQSKNNVVHPATSARPSVPRFPKLIFCLLVCLACCAVLLHGSAEAQQPTAAYWQYSAPGAINKVLIHDLNGDGFSEMLVVAESRLDAVQSNGQRLWRHGSPLPLLDVAVLQPVPDNDDEVSAELPTIAFLTAETLQILDHNGQTIVSIEAENNRWSRVVALNANKHNSAVVAILDASGVVYQFDGQGQFVGRVSMAGDPIFEADVRGFFVADIDVDGTEELILAYDNGSFGRVVIGSPAGNVLLSKIVLGGITAVLPVQFELNAPYFVATASGKGEVHLFDGAGSDVWPRTLGVTVSALAMVDWPELGRVLVVGNNVGRVVMFDAEGRRVADRFLCSQGPIAFFSAEAFAKSSCLGTPDSRIESLTVAEGTAEAGIVAPLLVSYTDEQSLLSNSHRLAVLAPDMTVIATGRSSSPHTLSRLVDINHDGLLELLHVNFSTLLLQSPNTTARTDVENEQNWPFNVQARPSTVLRTSAEGSTLFELFVGTSLGRANSGSVIRLRNSGGVDWAQPFGDEVTHLTLLEVPLDGSDDTAAGINANAPTFEERVLVVGYNGRSTQDETVHGWVQTVSAINPATRWNEPVALTGKLTALATIDDDNVTPAIVAGSGSGILTLIDSDGNVLWARQVYRQVLSIAVLSQNSFDSAPVIAVGTESTLYVYDLDGNRVSLRLFSGVGEAAGSANPADVCRTSADLLTLLEDSADGDVMCLGQALNAWRLDIGSGSPDSAIQIGQSVYTRVGPQGWQQTHITSDDLPEAAPELISDVSVHFVGDFTGDGQPDLALAVAGERLRLDLSEGGAQEIEIGSDVIHLTSISGSGIEPGLLVTTVGGNIRLFHFRPDHPPLVLMDSAEFDEVNGQYIFELTSQDIEAKPVEIEIELFDAQAGRFETVETQTLTEGQARIAVEAPVGELISYRIQYSDGVHEGVLADATALRGVPPPAKPPSFWWTVVTVPLVVGGLVVLFQSQSPVGRVRRFYRRIRQYPAATLPLIEGEYNRSQGSPDFLLNLANEARQRNNLMVGNIADGLYLLKTRPESAIPIINAALANVVHDYVVEWELFDVWIHMFKTSQKLLLVPSLTELILLRPRLMQLLDLMAENGRLRNVFSALQPIVDRVRDFERVDEDEDRLVYLNEAATLLRRERRLHEYELDTVESVMARAIVSRWLGLTTAEIESLRGRARLWVTLKTTRIAPAETTTLDLEILNTGRAPAEQISVSLEDGSIGAGETTQALAMLSPGRARRVQFAIHPPEQAQFRVAFRLTYSDRNQQGKTFEYGNIVNVLKPPRDYEPIVNPYAPGTPLREKSPLFFGRAELFAFIAEEAERLAQQSVLILVGQRRTGKTSALLRLGRYLPQSLLPVYIDCQSLGILPGMHALFNDIAWLVADALEERGLTIDVPELGVGTTQGNPAHWFQRVFVPDVRQKLPTDTTLVLVFDEFEALENLVEDGILPDNFFRYLRHLMQHGDGISFIFAGTRRLEALTADYWSVLFNIALYKEVTFLNRVSAEAVIQVPVEGHIVYDDLALDKLWRLTAGHPYFLQLVCYTLVKRANKQKTGYITISDVNAAVDEMLKLGEVHFAYLWQDATVTDRILLTTIAHLIDRDAPFRLTDLTRALEAYDVALEPADISASLARLVSIDILRESVEGTSAIFELKIGLVGAWVEQSKSLARLFN